MWPTIPYNLSHLCSDIYEVLLPFLRDKTEFFWGTLQTFLPVKDLSVNSTQSYFQALYVCIDTSLKVILIFVQIFHQEEPGSC